MKTALVIGATGLVGTQLVTLLLMDEQYSKVIVFTRRPLLLKHLKLEEHIISFDKPDQWQHLVKGDVLFSALGTTLQQAGSKEKQYTIDHTYQYNVARAAAGNHVPVYVLVSAAGANKHSFIFYNRMKGELERDIQQLPFNSINIIQPGLLTGKRKKNRKGEQAGWLLLTALNALGLLRKYKPIPANTVARAMINTASQARPGVQVYTLDAVFAIANTATDNNHWLC